MGYKVEIKIELGGRGRKKVRKKKKSTVTRSNCQFLYSSYNGSSSSHCKKKKKTDYEREMKEMIPSMEYWEEGQFTMPGPCHDSNVAIIVDKMVLYS